MSWSDIEDGRERAILSAGRQRHDRPDVAGEISESGEPILRVLEDAVGGFYFFTEEGVRVGNYDTRLGADLALGWFLEDEHWSPEKGETA